VYTTFALFVIASLGYYLDKPAWITIFAYEIVELIRFGRFFEEQHAKIDSLSKEILTEVLSWTRFIVWIVHAYFLFSMKDVHSKIICDSVDKYAKQKRSDNRIKYMMYGMAIVYGLLMFTKWFM
jgi:hypothetical protein